MGFMILSMSATARAETCAHQLARCLPTNLLLDSQDVTDSIKLASSVHMTVFDRNCRHNKHMQRSMKLHKTLASSRGTEAYSHTELYRSSQRLDTPYVKLSQKGTLPKSTRAIPETHASRTYAKEHGSACTSCFKLRSRGTSPYSTRAMLEQPKAFYPLCQADLERLSSKETLP